MNPPTDRVEPATDRVEPATDRGGPATDRPGPASSDRPGPALDLAQKVLDSQPFSRLLGARITAFGDGAATLELDIREELHQQNGFLHGGVLSYAADNALTFAGGAALGPAVLTGGFTIQYLRPAVGAVLRARARVVHAGRRQAVVRCDLLTADAEGTETLCAVAQGTVMPAGG
ncbi:PaaI family thioesterase [Streptomyces roseoviridis]|uniref:PaaI family thioesterase n=1 Tax=Streptomyces roseoviridis TaxID=67361 RepID=UPI0036D28A32